MNWLIDQLHDAPDFSRDKRGTMLILIKILKRKKLLQFPLKETEKCIWISF
jgi:hypothetical protein